GTAAAASPPGSAGIEGWVSGVVLESDTGGLDALLAGFAPSPGEGEAWDAGAVFIDPAGLVPPPFDPLYPVM
ncbi:MAG TPA: hypothetical protein VFF48_10045, partial [Brevundimonas sp.]|nr:hypothetical protein [Brevundimonas sp.]